MKWTIVIVFGLVGLLIVGGLIYMKTEQVLLFGNEGEGLEGLTKEISIDPNNTNQIGYEFINNSIHIWNTQDDYYFNKSSGIQFTNHYEDYWTRNVFCIGYYSGGTWNKIKCADELDNFNRNIITDNSTYVNATLWKDISYGSYDLRLGIRYNLRLHDKSLSVIPYAKNIGIDIPFDLGFAWVIKDWEIPNGTGGDKLYINDSIYDLNGTYDLLFKDMIIQGEPKPLFVGFDDEFLKVKWNENLNYAVKMVGDGNQSNFYIALLINAGHFNPNQEKQTIFQWIDATTLFTADAETGDLTEWDSTSTAGGTFVADAGSKKTGSYGFNMSYDGSGGIYGTGNFALQNNVYLKADVYISDTCSAGAWGQVNFFSLTRWGSGAVVKLKMDGSGNCYKWGIPGLTTDSNFSTNEWLEIELHYNNTGVIQFWVNNNLIQDITDNSETRLIDTTSIGGTGTLNAGSFFYFDNIEVSDERIGGATADTTPPTYNGEQTNNTVAGEITIFALNINDDTNLTDGGFIFSTNNTGNWVNDSFVAFTSTLSEWANVTKVLNSTVGTNVGYMWYINDTAGNTNSTSIFEVVTTSTSANCWKVDNTNSLIFIPNGCKYPILNQEVFIG